jgi:hypothetical protein
MSGMLFQELRLKLAFERSAKDQESDTLLTLERDLRTFYDAFNSGT